LKNYWNNISEEERRIRSTLISKAKKGKGNNLPTSPVIIVELNMRFESIKEFAGYINGDSAAVTRCLNGRGQKRHRGYTFRRV